MKKIRYSRACAALPLLAIIGHAGGVSAEETASESIVVTAMRGDAEAKAVAARTTVVSRDEMELKGLVTAADVLKSVPGLSVVQSGGAGGLTSVFSRGTNSKHTLALYDGIRLNDASTPNGQFNFGSDTLGDLNAVEVLRGAASAVYGSDAIGGVINFIPRIGGDKAFMPYGEIAAGSLNTYRGMLGVRGQAGPLAYGVTGEYVETEGFNTTAARLDDNYGEKDGNEIATFTANTELTLTEGLKLRGLARYRKSRTEFDDAGLDREGRGGRDSYTVWRVAPRYTTANGAYQGDLELGQVKNERSEYNRADVNSPGGPDTGAEGLRTFAAFRNRLDIADSDRLQATLSAGIEWHRERVSNFTGDLTTLDREEEFLAFYGLAQVTLADRINLNASLRQDDPEMFSAETTWNAGAVLQLPEIGGRIYATYGTSFKSPTLSERYTVSAWNIGNPDLMPEKGRSFEFGLDAGLDVSSAGWLGFQATYFDSRIDDLIEYDYALLQNLNVGRADINGYELGLHGRLGQSCRRRSITPSPRPITASPVNNCCAAPSILGPQI